MKFFKKLSRYLILLIVFAFIVLIWKSFPIITGYDAKLVCSAVFLEHRRVEDITSKDLNRFPFNLAHCTVDTVEKTVTADVMGLAKKTALYRRSSGATLLGDGHFVQPVNLSSPSNPGEHADTVTWPTGEYVPVIADSEIDTQKLAAVIENAMRDSSKKSNGITRAIVVVHKDRLIIEKYAKGFTAFTPQPGWSMTKSILNALIGILVMEKKINIDVPVPIEEWKGDERHTITLRQLMQMNSGLDWDEVYSRPSDATHMLFTDTNCTTIPIHSGLAHKPATIFNYSSGNANIISLVLRRTLGDSLYYKLPYQSLFYKIGMFHSTLETDAAGNFVGSSFCYATPRDWARFGLLYMHNGVWNGKRLLPEGWVDFTRTPQAAVNHNRGGQYGALWWLNRPNVDGVVRYPGIPEDCFSCQGFDGQSVWVIPSKDLVIVRMSINKNDTKDGGELLKAIINCIK